jgi:hypothetical protein
MSIDDLNNQETAALLTSKVSSEGAALLLAIAHFTKHAEVPNVSEPRIERVPGWTDQLIEQNDRLKQEKQNLEQDLCNITAVLDATHPYENPLVHETLLNRVKRVALAASNQVTTKGWRYPKPGDKLRVLKLETIASGPAKIGDEIEATECCETTCYNSEMHKSSYAVCYKLEGSEIYGVIPFECVEPA